MKIGLLIPVVLLGSACLAQPVLSRDSADFYLNKIDNQAVVFVPGAAATARMNADARRLYIYANNYIINSLIGLLENGNKTLVSHVLLTKLLEPGNEKYYYSTESLTDTILVSCVYNGLSWKDYYDKINLNTQIRIDSAEIKRITRYWVSRKENPLHKEQPLQ